MHPLSKWLKWMGLADNFISNRFKSLTNCYKNPTIMIWMRHRIDPNESIWSNTAVQNCSLIAHHWLNRWMPLITYHHIAASLGAFTKGRRWSTERRVGNRRRAAFGDFDVTLLLQRGFRGNARWAGRAALVTNWPTVVVTVIVAATAAAAETDQMLQRRSSYLLLLVR